MDTTKTTEEEKKLIEKGFTIDEIRSNSKVIRKSKGFVYRTRFTLSSRFVVPSMGREVELKDLTDEQLDQLADDKKFRFLEKISLKDLKAEKAEAKESEEDSDQGGEPSDPSGKKAAAAQK